MTRSSTFRRRALQAAAFALCTAFTAIAPAQQDYPSR